jgi:hypothetical protein
LIAEKYIDKVVEVRRISDRLIAVRLVVGRTILNVICVYAPQVGRIREEKEFWVSFSMSVAAIRTNERLIICGDTNGHVGERIDGFERVHCGNGYGEWNAEGEMLLEFAEAMELAVVNTWFRKDIGKRVTYASSGNKSQIDYVLVKRSNLSSVKDIKTIAGEECVQQHRLLMCILDINDKIRRSKEKPASKWRVWRLKDEGVREQFMKEIESKLSDKKGVGVEEVWKRLKDSLLEAAEKVCGAQKVDQNAKKRGGGMRTL